ncbi:MAG: alanine racemase [Rhodospirillaceae bacterium]|nr:alanine racemase [Rhodospirillaceae bacterium]
MLSRTSPPAGTAARPSASRPEDRAGAILTIDLAAIAENWRILKKRVAPGCDMGAVVKSDAYGLGLEPVARALQGAGCVTFYVAHLDGAIALRHILGPGPRIACLNGPNKGTERDHAAFKVMPVLSTPEHVKAWCAYALKEEVLSESIVQVDTGMHRLGLSEREFAGLMDDPDGFLGLHPQMIMSHLACADEGANPMNRAQLGRFRAMRDTFRTRFPDAKASLANSSGIFLGPEWHFDYARPGAALYGVNPTPKAPNPMLPVVNLKARIIQVRRVDSPGHVGYGAAAHVQEGAKIATVSMGYADGYLRSLSAVGLGVLDGLKVPLLGRVSMDLMTFDVSNVPDSAAQPGAFIDIISNVVTVDDVAKAAGTIGYEILTSLGSRFHRRYITAPQPRAGT